LNPKSSQSPLLQLFWGISPAGWAHSHVCLMLRPQGNDIFQLAVGRLLVCLPLLGWCTTLNQPALWSPFSSH
jgi:hypothetical protein